MLSNSNHITSSNQSTPSSSKKKHMTQLSQLRVPGVATTAYCPVLRHKCPRPWSSCHLFSVSFHKRFWSHGSKSQLYQTLNLQGQCSFLPLKINAFDRSFLRKKMIFRLEQFLSTSGSYQATLLGKATTVGGCRVEEITTMTSAQGRSDWIGSALEINVPSS